MRTPIYLEISPDHLKKLETIANSGKSEVDHMNTEERGLFPSWLQLICRRERPLL